MRGGVGGEVRLEEDQGRHEVQIKERVAPSRVVAADFARSQIFSRDFFSHIHVHLNLSIYLSISIRIYLSKPVFIYLSLSIYLYLSIYLFIYMSHEALVEERVALRRVVAADLIGKDNYIKTFLAMKLTAQHILYW